MLTKKSAVYPNCSPAPSLKKRRLNVVEKEREKLAQFQAGRAELQERIDSL